jgi:hypothetical protein
MKYPTISDNDFYNKINHIYKKYTIPDKRKTFKEIKLKKIVKKINIKKIRRLRIVVDFKSKLERN